MLNRIKYLLIVIFFAAAVFQSCLKDNPITTARFNLDNNALLLNYLETNGNYIESDEMPSIINVDEVYNNLNNFLIIDVRAKDKYFSGHIPGAVNVQNDSLLEFITSQENISKYSKIIIVSSDGQSSSYYTCLLRLYGIDNVYSLNFGMAEWNRVFSDVWIQNARDSNVNLHLESTHLLPNSPGNSLPDINFKQKQGTLQEKVKGLIASIIKEGFNYNQIFVSLNPQDTSSFNGESMLNFYIISYGSVRLYYYLVDFPMPSGHLPNAYFYTKEDLKSTSNLQTLPPDKRIVIYTQSGQISSFIAAYLRVLGYDAKSLSFGAHSFFYSRMIFDKDFFSPYVFLQEDIRNYPYISGSSPK